MVGIHPPPPVKKGFHYHCPHDTCVWATRNRKSYVRHHEAYHKATYKFVCQCGRGFNRNCRYESHVRVCRGSQQANPVLRGRKPRYVGGGNEGREEASPRGRVEPPSRARRMDDAPPRGRVRAPHRGGRGMARCQTVADVLQAQTFEDMEERIRTLEMRNAELEEINKDQKKRIQYFEEVAGVPRNLDVPDGMQDQETYAAVEANTGEGDLPDVMQDQETYAAVEANTGEGDVRMEQEQEEFVLVLSPSPISSPAASGSLTAVTPTSPAITALPPVDTLLYLRGKRSGRVSGSTIRERARKELRQC